MTLSDLESFKTPHCPQTGSQTLYLLFRIQVLPTYPALSLNNFCTSRCTDPCSFSPWRLLCLVYPPLVRLIYVSSKTWQARQISSSLYFVHDLTLLVVLLYYYFPGAKIYKDKNILTYPLTKHLLCSSRCSKHFCINLCNLQSMLVVHPSQFHRWGYWNTERSSKDD